VLKDVKEGNFASEEDLKSLNEKFVGLII